MSTTDETGADDLRPASRARLALQTAVLAAIEAEVAPSTVWEVVEAEIGRACPVLAPVSVSAEPGGEGTCDACLRTTLPTRSFDAGDESTVIWCVECLADSLLAEQKSVPGVEADGYGLAESDDIAAWRGWVHGEEALTRGERALGRILFKEIDRLRALATSAAPVVETGGIVQTTAGEVEVGWDVVVSAFPLEIERVAFILRDQYRDRSRELVFGDRKIPFDVDDPVLVRRASTDRAEGAERPSTFTLEPTLGDSGVSVIALANDGFGRFVQVAAEDTSVSLHSGESIELGEALLRAGRWADAFDPAVHGPGAPLDEGRPAPADEAGGES